MNGVEAWNEAWKWLRRQRKNAPPDSDVWHLRFWKNRDDAALYSEVQQGRYRLSPMHIVQRKEGETVAIWSARDALVLKWVALQIAPLLPVHPCCHSVKGMGVKYSLQRVFRVFERGDYPFVYRTDIRGYYQHITKEAVISLIAQYVPSPQLRDLVGQFVYYSLEDGGEFHTPQAGISRGCALSPLLGVALLSHIDNDFSQRHGVFYVRYMDDFLLMAPTRWALRRAIGHLNRYLDAGGFTVHPDKTWIGRTDKGFDWLGVWFDATGTRPSPRAINNHRERCQRLYEQTRRQGLSEQRSRARVRAYRRRWIKYIRNWRE